MVDWIEEYWGTTGCEGTMDTLVLYCDNGPERHSRRTLFMKRIVEGSASVCFNRRTGLRNRQLSKDEMDKVESRIDRN